MHYIAVTFEFSVPLQKVQLMNFEKSFQDKVKEVDERYKSKIHDLMVQNTQIR